MADQIRVGILGAGAAGTGHATAFSQLPGVEITALWSRTRARAEGLAGQLHLDGATVYGDWQALIERAEVDVIGVATPEFFRREPVAAALERGCHVLVEKPISVELADAQEMVRLAEAAGTVTATCLVWRYSPGTQVALREVQAGRIGRLLDLQMEWRLRAPPRLVIEARPYFAEAATGLLGGGGSHEFDRARYFSGCEFVRIVGRVLPCSRDREPEYVLPCSVYMLLAELTDGLLGQFRYTFTSGQPEWSALLHGDEGTLHVTHQEVIRQCGDEDEAVSLDIPASERVPEGLRMGQHVWNRLIADFITAVRRGDVDHTSVPHLPTLVDGLRAQEVIDAAMRSEAERRWVEVRQEF